MLVAVASLVFGLYGLCVQTASAAPCDVPIQNAIVCENSMPGNPPSEWDVTGAGDASIQGFASDISADQGQTVHFKVDTDSTDYHLDVYRMGFYGGDGARKVAIVAPSASLPQSQPACLDDPATGLVDCGNWAESATWAVPADAVSGIYFAKLVRDDAASGGSHIYFVVRDDDGQSDLLFQTMDTTWQAYNRYGGNSLYTGSSGVCGERACKVSYNRPFTTRGPTPEDSPFNAEYPMVRWLERNGYDVSYFTGVDADRSGGEILEHQAYLSVGHDEYWSGTQRANVEAARGAGVDLAFFSGNEIFWKTRWENSIDGSGTDHRTLVVYKETHANAKIDPTPAWTGTWRDPRFSPPADGGRPENALSGTIFKVNSGTSAIEVPAADGKMRLWRNTDIASLAPNQTATLSANTLGYEWDEDPDNGSRPPGLVRMSSTTRNGVEVLQDYGSNYASSTATHHLTLYRAPSGALVFGAGTIQWSWGLDGEHDRGGSTPDARMQQATVNLLADMGAQPDTLQGGLVGASASTDTQAPATTISSPLGGSNVESGQAVAVSGVATDSAGETGGGQVGGVEVSTDGGNTWHPADGRDSWTYSWTPGATGSATIRARAADDSGNLETPGAQVAVNIVPHSCPCSIWDDSFTAPGDGDPNAVEVGVKFRSDQAGFITGLRFFKTPGNTGTHVGHLWTAAGTQLAEATFSGETASGWQEASFGSSVAIDANTTYVASYHAPNGNYAANNGYFASTGFDSAPLHALGNGVDGPNGIYKYGPSGGLFAGGGPNSFGSSNYWVDVVFEDVVGPDNTPPTINARTPGSDASGVSAGTDVTATFSEAMDSNTINAGNVELRDPGNALVPATVSYSPAQRRVTLDPNISLQNSTTYTAKIKGGAGGVTDVAGNALAADSIWSFTTAAPPPPPPDEGPGGPILVISDSGNPFGRYYAEILRAEGLNEFTVTDLSTVTPAVLGAYDVVILGDSGLSAAQVTTLSDWVQAGGNLIAMRPDAQLAGLLGLTDTPDTLANSYLRVDTGTGPGAGIVDQTIQFHGTADRYTLNGAQTIATLYSDATSVTANPAVTLQGVGSSGGQAAAFAYDLARSVVYTRQGNPAWSGQERDSGAGGTSPIRSDDLFFGAKPGDVQPDWVDLNKVAIPQADEQQRLLTNLIEQMNVDRKPLPRFWFLPRDEKAAVVMTGDDHANGGTEDRFNQYQALNPGCSVADWECVRGTSYIYTNTTSLTNAEATAFENTGFEIALHVLTNCADWADRSELESFYTSQLAALAANYPGLTAPSTNRTHCIAWGDWATQPKVELENGIRLDTNYYYWPPSWVQDRPGMFTGSGMPMRFADLDGSMIDVYQAVTQMTDESGQSFPFTIDTLLDRALGPEGYYGVFTANMHTDIASSLGSDAIVSSAQARSVPVVSARQMLTWLDGRNNSSFDSISWNANKLSFTIDHGAGANGLRAMVPTASSVGSLTTVKLDNAPIATTTRTIKGQEYAFFDAASGSYEATYAVDDTAPVISNVAHSAQGDGTATITWDTNEASNSRVDYGTNANDLNQSQSNPALATSHSLQLTGLAPNTTYHYRVTSADVASNSTTEPDPPAAPASFSTPSGNFTDTTVADFSAGTPDADTYVSQTGDGEVILKPTEGQEFSGGPGLPAGWSGQDWSAQGGGVGGTAALSGGALRVNGAFASTDTAYGPGRSLEFVATFGAGTFQHVALTDNFDSAWAMFSTRGSTSQLFASTEAGSLQDSAIPGSGTLIGSPHRYRIEWAPTEVRYYVDGALVQTHSATFGPNLRAAASEFNAGGPELSVDWIHLSPYPAAGTFDSRVFDAGAGQNAAWGALSWNATTPAGTAVALSARTGGTPTPDPSWSAFAPIATSGGDIPGSSRYVQYRAQLSTSDQATTPTLSDVSMAYATGADTTAPTITNRSPAPNATDVARDTNLAVQFGEAMDPATIDATSVRLRKQGAGSDVAANVSYSSNTATLNPDADLDFNSVYVVTVAGTVEDTAGNPLGADDSWSFTTAAQTFNFTDTTVADFSAGTPDADTYVSQTGDGEVILKPTEGQEFSGGPGLPAGWTSCPWNAPDPENCTPGTGATVAGGNVHVNGAYARTSATYGSGRSLEFVANFGGENNEHVGFAVDLNASANWAIFSLKFDGTFNARTTNGGSTTETPLSTGLIGSAHRYRIEWAPTEVRFYVDGALVATHAANFGATQMRPIASDLTAGAQEIAVDWIHLSPYPAAGTFDSRVFDAGAGQNAAWGALSWNATTPAGTAVALSARTGGTPTPDPSWSAFAPIATSGGDIPGSSRYVQYRAQLSTSDQATTPTLSDVSIAYATGADTTAPTITNRSPAPNATDVARDTNLAVQFGEAMDPATIDATSVRLRKQGAGSDVAANVSYSSNTATLNPDADLDFNSVYVVTVAGTVEDTAGNPLGADDSWSFTTAAQTFNFTDTTVADFSAGTPDADTYVSQTGDGEVILKPTEGQEFSGGPGLPAGWTSCPWNAPDPENCTPGTGATVAGGNVHVNGAYARTSATYGSGRSLEFVANFNAVPFETAGFAVDLNAAPWATFSTKADGNTFYTRTDNGQGSQIENTLPASLLGSPHRYRIEWAPTEVRFYVDGALVQTHAVTFSQNMRPIASEFNAGGPELSVDWIHLSPYPAAGTFDSRVFDAGAGQNAAWGALSWNATTPAGTAVALSARTGGTPTPDPSWSAFAPIATSGGDIPGSSRYVQYRAQLSTSDQATTPTLSDVSISGTQEEDSTAPETTIQTGPTGLTNDPTPTFTFSSEPGASFECSIDDGSADFGPCSGPGDAHTPAANLPDGSYTFRVRATDQALNTDPTPATQAFEVDTAAPAAPTLAATVPASPANDNSPKVQGAAPAGSTVRLYTSADCSGTPTATGTAAELGGAGITVSVPDDSNTTIYATATTPADNTSGCSTLGISDSSVTYSEDSTAPETTIQTGPTGLTNDPTPTFTFSSEPGASFECSIDDGSADFGPCSGPGDAHTPAANLPDGSYTFRVRATDQALNTDPTPATQAFEVDTAAPAAPTLAATVPASPANDNSPKVQGAAPAGSTVRLYTSADCSGTPTATGTAAELGGAGITVSVPDDSNTTIYATATTPADNTSGCSTSSVTYSEDSTAPETTIQTGPTGLTNDPTPTFTFSSEPGASFECSIDDGSADFGPCSGPGDAHTPAANLPDGSYTFRVRATDQALNTDPTPATQAFEVDTAAPAAPTLAATVPASPANDNSPKVQGAAPAGSTVRLYTSADCSGTPTATGTAAELGGAGITVTVADNSTTAFRATATDAVNNTSPCSAPLSYTEQSVANGKITFTSARDGNQEIYSMGADGTSQTRLTTISAADYDPDLSPNAQRIAFTSKRDGNDEIYAMNADGSAQTRLTTNSAADTNPVFSPDGQKIAFASTRDGNSEVYLMNADGTGVSRLTSNSAFDGFPAFSPSGARIAFTSLRDGSLNFEIYSMAADGSDQTRLTNDPGYDLLASFSPDGTKIAFSSTRAGNLEIYSANADGSSPVRLTNNPAAESWPTFSPDGQKISFASTRDGNDEIYSMNADGSRARPATPTPPVSTPIRTGEWRRSTPRPPRRRSRPAPPG